MSVAKILVVEDEGLTAMEIQRKLRNWGYEVPSFAFSRKEAVKKAEEIKPDLILMDIMLKGKGDGVDAAQEIKSVRDIPIIYITAYDDFKTRERAEITNPNAYLIKPFEEKELQNKIETALSEHKLGKNLLNIAKRLDNKLKGFGVIVIDFKGNIIYLNDLASNLTGFTKENVVGKDLKEVFPIELIKKDTSVENQLKLFIKENTGIPTRAVLNKNGADVHVEYNINTIMDEENGFIGAELVFEDITQHLKDEKSLIEREEKFRGIYYQSMVASEIFDENGNFIDANPACMDLFGVNTIDQLKKFNLFNDFKLNSKELEVIKNGLESNYESEFNFEQLKSAGFETQFDFAKYLNISITPMKLDGAINGYLVQFQDITGHWELEKSLQDSQDRYLNILDTLDQVLLAFDDDLKCIYCNNAITHFSDLNAKDLIDKSFQEAMKSFWDEEIESMCMGTLETGQPSSTIKTSYNDKIPLHIQIKAYKSFDGLMIIINDVTELKQREKELERNENLYRSVVNDQSELICRFNHDLELTFANEAYYRIFGLNNNLNSVFSLSQEDMDKMKSQFKSFDAENHIKIFEGPIRMPNGDISWWQWVTRAKFDDDGNISEYQSVGRDLTQHHHDMEVIQNKLKNLQFSLEEKNEELNDVQESFKLKIDEKSRKWDVIRESFEMEIKDKTEKISSLEKFNENTSKKFKEESQKLTETLNKNVKELDILRDNELSLKENLKLLEDDVHHKKIEAENSHNALEKEIDLRKKTEEELQEISSTLVEQLFKTESALSEIQTLKKQVKEKDAEINQIKTDFETEISQNKTDFETEISQNKTDFETEISQNKTDFENEITQITTDFQAKISDIESMELEARQSLDKKDEALKNVYSGVKKNMRMISTLNRLHSEYVTDQMIKKLQDGRSYLRSFGMVHEKLYQSKDLETVNLKEYLDGVLDDILRSHGVKNVDINLKTNDISLNMETAVLAGLIVTELVINSLKHAFPDGSAGKIIVEVLSDDDVLIINVSDDGIGIPQDTSLDNIDSFGLQLIKTLVEQSEGSMEFNGENGTNYILKIPKNSK